MHNWNSAAEQEQKIKKHLNFIWVYGLSEFNQDMFFDLSTAVYYFTIDTQSNDYFHQVIAIHKACSDFKYERDFIKDFFEPKARSSSHDSGTSKKIMQALTSANRLRAEFASTVNILNHIYLLKAMIDKQTHAQDHFLMLKLIEQYTLCFGALLLVLLRFLTTLYDLKNTTNKYDYHKKLKNYKYSLMMDTFMLPVNIINVVFVLLRQNDFLPIIGIVSFVFELGLGFIRYGEIFQSHRQCVDNLTNGLQDKNEFLKAYHACRHYDEVMALLKQRLDDPNVTLTDKSIFLSLVLEEQKTELELKKIRYNSLVCSLVLAIFVVFEQLIFQHLIVSNLTPQSALIVTIAIVYCCYLLKSLIVDTWVPHSLNEGVELKDKRLVHGRIKDKSAYEQQDYLTKISVAIRIILPLLSMVFLNFFSLETTIYLMLTLCVLQSIIGDTLRNEQDLVGESSDEMFEHGMGETPTSGNTPCTT